MTDGAVVCFLLALLLALAATYGLWTVVSENNAMRDDLARRPPPGKLYPASNLVYDEAADSWITCEWGYVPEDAAEVRA